MALRNIQKVQQLKNYGHRFTKINQLNNPAMSLLPRIKFPVFIQFTIHLVA